MEDRLRTRENHHSPPGGTERKWAFTRWRNNHSRTPPKTPNVSWNSSIFPPKKPNHISTGSRYRILTGNRNATTPKEPQWSEETDQPEEAGYPDCTQAGEPRKNLPSDSRNRRHSHWGWLVRIFNFPIIKWNARLRNSCTYRLNDSRGQSSYFNGQRDSREQVCWNSSTVRGRVGRTRSDHQPSQRHWLGSRYPDYVSSNQRHLHGHSYGN